MGNKYTVILPLEDDSLIEDADEGTLPPPTSSCGRLLVGPIDFMLQEGLLEELGITSVVSCLPFAPEGIDTVLSSQGINPATDYRVYPLEDNVDHYLSLFCQPDVFTITEFIHRRMMAGKSVLVHCDAGITRSPAVVVAYLMTKMDMSYDEACEVIRTRRERFDICAFAAELKKLSELTLSESMPSRSFSVNVETSVVSTPTVSLPYVVMEDLRTQWTTVRRKLGGHLGMAAVFLKHWGSEVGTPHDMSAGTTAVTHMRMLHQFLWGGCSHVRLSQLIRLHSHLDLRQEHMRSFAAAIRKVMEEGGTFQEEQTQCWVAFIMELWGLWTSYKEREVNGFHLQSSPSGGVAYTRRPSVADTPAPMFNSVPPRKKRNT